MSNVTTQLAPRAVAERSSLHVPDSLVNAATSVQLDRVSKSFGNDLNPDGTLRAPVLMDISLDVRAGEFVCLLGASGCGKSTLLNLIAGLDSPTKGVIETPGGRTALMFQESALFPWLTAGGNIKLALRLADVPKADWDPETERLLELVHLGGQGDKRIHELSGGMRQRVALARALAQRSKILLMDEPFAALDAITRDVLHEELSRIWQEEQLSIIFVTHNVREAVRLGQRVMLMSSRPGTFVRQWDVDVTGERRIEAPEIAALASEITTDLRREIRRHAK